MSIFLGSSGLVRLERASANKARTSVSAGDVNPSKKRFKLGLPTGTLQTGDKLYMRRLDASGVPSTSNLDFIDATAWPGGAQQPDGSWYIHVDNLDGIRLFSNWSQALRGDEADALSLSSIASGYPLVVSTGDNTDHILGGVQSYELSTNRAAIDVTSLGDAFVNQYEGLLSGQGALECLWDFQTGRGDTDTAAEAAEVSQYFHQIVARQKLGSRFRAALYLKQPEDSGAYGEISLIDSRTALFYGIEGVVTNVAISFSPGEPVISRIQFVTTGQIDIFYEPPAFYLLTQASNVLTTQQNNPLVVTP